MAGKLLVSPGEKATEKVRFGNFEVMNDPEGRPVLLGKGTFGRTYQARHCFLDTVVALKIITERYVADAAVRQRFLTSRDSTTLARWMGCCITRWNTAAAGAWLIT